jgi:hypothetical protein
MHVWTGVLTVEEDLGAIEHERAQRISRYGRVEAVYHEMTVVARACACSAAHRWTAPDTQQGEIDTG